jgi:C-terminal processing protease CtpA/Prc
MDHPRNYSRIFAPFALIAGTLVAGCGGGGGGGGAGGGQPSTTSTTGTTGTGSGWVHGQFLPASDFAAHCAVPRTGIDPYTNKAYPDVQGTALDERNWLRSWNNDLYLWFGEVVDQDPGGFTSDAAYFDVLKTTATTPSGKPKDRFHFTYSTSTWESLSQSGVEPGYGASFVVLVATPPRKVVVAYTEPGSPAASSPASLERGAEVLAIDGVDLVNADDQASINTLNAGLSPQTVGESHTFSVLDTGASSPRNVTLVSANVTETPVRSVQTLPGPGGTLIGYMLFNDQIATAESELAAAFDQLRTAGVQDLVLDLRYNGGGYLDIASEVAYMIAGGARTSGQTFELDQFNSKYPTTNPVTQTALTPVGFHSTAQGFSVPVGTALPALNLSRVFVLTTADTCSASEAIVNGLRGVNVQVIQIGSTTCGKPYGFYPADNCGVTYFSIQFQGVNAQNFGDYPDGFTPSNALTPDGIPLPGCAVADDFTHALGDPAENLLSSALSYAATGACPLPPSSVQPGASIRSPWRRNRIVRPSSM